jgi:hypothetical protein
MIRIAFLPVSSRIVHHFSMRSMEREPNQNSRLILHEENRLPLIRSLDTFPAVTNTVSS